MIKCKKVCVTLGLQVGKDYGIQYKTSCLCFKFLCCIKMSVYIKQNYKTCTLASQVKTLCVSVKVHSALNARSVWPFFYVKHTLDKKLLLQLCLLTHLFETFYFRIHLSTDSTRFLQLLTSWYLGYRTNIASMWIHGNVKLPASLSLKCRPLQFIFSDCPGKEVVTSNWHSFGFDTDSTLAEPVELLDIIR